MEIVVKDLINRLENIAEPSRELDRDIAEVFGWERNVVVGEDDYWKFGDYSWTREDNDHPPRFTDSVDAVLTLLPNGSIWNILILSGDPFYGKVGPARSRVNLAITFCIAVLKRK